MHAAFRIEQPRTFLTVPGEDDSEIENRTYEHREIEREKERERGGGTVTGFRGI